MLSKKPLKSHIIKEKKLEKSIQMGYNIKEKLSKNGGE